MSDNPNPPDDPGTAVPTPPTELPVEHEHPETPTVIEHNWKPTYPPMTPLGPQPGTTTKGTPR